MDDVRNLLKTEVEFGTAELSLLRKAVNRLQAVEVRQEVNAAVRLVGDPTSASEPTLTKLGVAQHLLGNHGDAYRLLSGAKKHPVAAMYLGHVCIALDRPAEAIDAFARAAALGYDPIEAELQRVGALRASGQIDEAQAALKAIASKAVSRADYSFQFGCILADRGDTLGAIEYFERAVDMDPYHSRALFWLANENARQGNDDDAILLYERALSKPPLHVGSLLNLGIIYEDTERYDQAAFCYRRVLEADPQNPRARLYLKDIDASEGQFYDEESLKAEQRLQHTLSRPIADFELSVRSRNCLDRLGIVTLGDLTEISEQELMASRNFGETSLTEVRELLEQNGLRVGQAVESKKPDSFVPPTDMSPEQRAAIEQTISDLQLSVRSRKCMSRLNITTVGELITKTPDELLGSKNFGVTSLNEIRGKLAEVGLRLRND
ncbi:tetratricopeptide repeat protein [bacterium]|nr:tetratricopeptide repeat protein [bacterium]